MSTAIEAAIAVNRFGLGARPGELSGLDSPKDWLRRQLRADGAAPTGAALKSSQEILAGVAELASERGEPQAGAADESAQQQRQQQLATRLPRYYRPIYVAEARARLQHATTTDFPFLERLVHFWSNHFAVSVDKIAVLGLAGSMEREAIRPHVLGRFSDLLMAVEQHPAMLLFLDNQQSIGPNSTLARRAGQRGRELGLNENLAREILELHTLGVDGGYSQADVTSFARVITGWSISGARGPLRRLESGDPGRFLFRELVHEPGTQTVLGKRYAQQGVAQGEAVLRDLATAPATARHLATKLARHFIADDPPPGAVQRIASAYSRSGGELAAVYDALIDAPEAWRDPVAKFKTPADYVHSIYRGLQLPVPEGQQALVAFELLGQRQFMPGSPAGWPDRSADWDGSAALMKRIEFADAVAQRVGNARDTATLAPQLLGDTLNGATREAMVRAATGVQALTLLLTAPEFMRR
jgi:uncharacterized protein (DUF1800 family)